MSEEDLWQSYEIHESMTWSDFMDIIKIVHERKHPKKLSKWVFQVNTDEAALNEQSANKS